MFVGEQDIQPLRVLHLGADEVPQDALKHSSVCRHLLVDSSNAGVVLRLHFIRLAVDISARLGVDTVQVVLRIGSLCVSYLTYMCILNYLWPPCVIGQTIIFLPWFFLSSFFLFLA